MKPIILTSKESNALAGIALLGLLIPNGVFVYYFLTDQGRVRAALTNPISLVFIVEAFVLMFLFAWLLKKTECKRPTGMVFIIMSVIGSMAFSVPATLSMLLKPKKNN